MSNIDIQRRKPEVTYAWQDGARPIPLWPCRRKSKYLVPILLVRFDISTLDRCRLTVKDDEGLGPRFSDDLCSLIKLNFESTRAREHVFCQRGQTHFAMQNSLSYAPILVWILSMGASLAFAAGTKHPIWAMMIPAAVILNKVLFPAMLGPVNKTVRG
jgi:hypothetical protein